MTDIKTDSHANHNYWCYTDALLISFTSILVTKIAVFYRPNNKFTKTLQTQQQIMGLKNCAITWILLATSEAMVHPQTAAKTATNQKPTCHNALCIMQTYIYMYTRFIFTSE